MAETDDVRAVTVYGLDQARAAAAVAARLGKPLVLLSGPAAAASVGPAWFRALIEEVSAEFPDVAVRGVLDCAGFAGHAMAALREGGAAIVYDGPARERVAAIAAGLGTPVLRRRPPSLDARDAAARDDLDKAIESWLTAPGPGE